MFKAALKPLLAATVGAATLSFGPSIEAAQAARLTYDFTVTLPSQQQLENNLGSLYSGYSDLGLKGGQSFKGKFSFDDTAFDTVLDLKTLGLKSVSQAINEGGLEVNFNFLRDKPFTQADDSSSPIYPRVFFNIFEEQGIRKRQLVGLDFLVTLPGKGSAPTLDQPGFRISGLEADPDNLFNDFSLGASDVTDGKPIGYGIVKYGSPRYEAVPAPSGVGGLLLVGGLVGLRVWKRRKQDKVKLPCDRDMEN